MKRTFSLLITTLTILCLHEQVSGYVTIQGKQFKNEVGNDFYPLIMNYSVTISHNQYPATVSTDLDINPHIDYGSSNKFEESDGSIWISKDFQEIRTLGFNTVRLITQLKRFNSVPVSSICNGIISGSYFGFSYLPRSFNIDPNLNGTENKRFAIQPPYSSDPNINLNMSLYLEKVSEICTLAEQSDLRVILLTADGFDLFSSQAAVDDYQAFLEVLTSFFSNNSTIMAYDLDNEPSFKDADNHVWNRSKHEVCDYVSQLYDAIKISDGSHHLITIGLGNSGTIFNWDPDVMKIDFVSLHIYPTPDFKCDYLLNGGNRQIVMQHAIDRLFNEIYWASQVVQRPWVLEETGFSSSAPSQFPHDWNCYGVNGSFTDLETFISDLVPVVKNCGVSGLAWWNFQDLYSTTTPPSVCDPLVDQSKDFREKSWGLVSEGTPPLGGNYQSANLEKLSIPTEFENFSWNSPPSLCAISPSPAYTESESYYDPFQFGMYNPSTNANRNSVEGHITDTEGNPVKGALVYGACWQSTFNLNGVDVYNHFWNYSYSDYNGYYKIIPFNYLASNNVYNKLTDVRVVAPGSSWDERGWLGEDQLVNSVYDFEIEKQDIQYSESIIANIPSGDIHNYTAWNELNLTGEILGQSEISARQQVNLLQDFHAARLGRTHIFTQNTFLNCMTYSSYRRAIPFSYKEQITPVVDEILITFLTQNNNFNIRVFPNPNNGVFNVKIENSQPESSTEIIIKNLMGSSLINFTSTKDFFELDKSSLSKGAYIIEAINNFNKTTCKLLIQ